MFDALETNLSTLFKDISNGKENVIYVFSDGETSGEGDCYDENDRLLLASIYRIWNTYWLLAGLGGRRANWSRTQCSCTALCLELNFFKVNSVHGGFSSSFDCYDPNEDQRIQVKVVFSSTNELSTFGPNSVFDELYFLDFFNQGQ